MESGVAEQNVLLELSLSYVYLIRTVYAQRGLATILEVSVEFADVQRRLENTESVLSRLKGTRLVKIRAKE